MTSRIAARARGASNHARACRRAEVEGVAAVLVLALAFACVPHAAAEVPMPVVQVPVPLAQASVPAAQAPLPAASVPAPAACDEAATMAARAPQRGGPIELLGSARIDRIAQTATQDVGGLSGLDFDPAAALWYLLSDDRGARAPARFYPARIAFDGRGFGAIDVLAPVVLPLHAGERPDPEALRLLPCTGLFAWASEGDGPLRQKPTVRLVTSQGWAAGELALPARLRFAADGRSGARANHTIEGLAPTPDGRALWVAMESPLIEDGPEPDAQHGALARFTRLPLAGGPAPQWAYPLDALRRVGVAGQRRADNGVSEILAFAGGTLLVVERAGREVAPDRFDFDVRVYEASTDGADEIAGLEALEALDARTVRPMTKRLLLDLATLGLPHLDNVEGAAWGPRLDDGRATLVLVSDDNFAPNQITQFLFLAMGSP